MGKGLYIERVGSQTLSPRGYAGHIGKAARKALLEEVYTGPKPGLVDPFSNGAHQDMTLADFERSAFALEPFFTEMARMGLEGPEDPERLFLWIRSVGIRAEKAMYKATGGVNTHKGAIFTLGILCAATGACRSLYGKVTLSDLVEIEQKMTRRILLEEIEKIFREQDLLLGTHGQQNLKAYGVLGVRGEAAWGYPSVTELALPVLLDGSADKQDPDRSKLQALFVLMSQVEDGNVLARAGKKGMEEVRQIARAFLRSGGVCQKDALEQLERMDRYFVKKNYSNGGCADLLAAAIFLKEVIRGRWAR